VNPSPTGQLILGPDHASAELLEELLGRPTTQVFDRWADQRQELDRLRPAVNHDLLDEPAAWVYYPWRRSVVRILGPRSFAAVRLDRNRNKITAEEQARLGRLRLGVVGLSVGHGIAHLLAMEGLCGELRLADYDDVALSNLNRIPATLFDLGLNKAVVTARRIAEIDPYLRVLAYEQGITEATAGEFIDGLDCVIEECDSLDVKIQVRHMARRRGIPVVMETSDRGLLDVERFDLEPGRPIFHGLLDGLATEELGGLSRRKRSLTCCASWRRICCRPAWPPPWPRSTTRSPPGRSWPATSTWGHPWWGRPSAAWASGSRCRRGGCELTWPAPWPTWHPRSPPPRPRPGRPTSRTRRRPTTSPRCWPPPFWPPREEIPSPGSSRPPTRRSDSSSIPNGHRGWMWPSGAATWPWGPPCSTPGWRPALGADRAATGSARQSWELQPPPWSWAAPRSPS